MHRVRSVIKAIADVVETNHVDLAVGQTAGDAARLFANEGDLTATPTELASRLTAAMRLASGDGHIYVEAVDPERPEQDWIGEWLERGPATGWGVATRQLDDVGVLSISSFYPLEHSASAIDDAFISLDSRDRWILDLTDNGGGDEDAADALIGTFLPDLTTRAFAIRTKLERLPPASPPRLPWGRTEPDRPLAIVVNRRTFSAPEAVAFAFQENRRGLVVGERSAGGANMLSDPFPINDEYRVGVPIRAPIGIRSGKNWEGVGVQPDVVVDGDGVGAAAARLRN